MQTTLEALKEGFHFISDEADESSRLNRKIQLFMMGSTALPGYFSYEFGDGYELCFEPLLWDGQMYVALYKDKSLLTTKVVIKPGFIRNEDDL